MSDEPGIYDFTIYKGATFTRTFTYKDSAGDAINLTGYGATFKAKPSPGYSTTPISLSSGSGITLGGAAGTIAVTISATDTAALTDDEYVYSLCLTNGGTVNPILRGTITASNEVIA